MAKKIHEKKKRKNTAGARVIPVLLLCVCVMSGLLWFTKNGENPGKDVPAGTDPEPEDAESAGSAEFAEPAEPEEPTAEELLMERIGKMTLEEKVGQMFLIHCPESESAAAVEKYHPGGMIFFARDFRDKTPEQAASDIAACQAAADIPLVTAVDEEGGTVNRVSRYPQYRSEPFLSPQQLYAAGGWDRILSDTVEKCQLLSSLGLNLNVAPVCDVAADPANYIYDRTFGGDAECTSLYVRRVVTCMTEHNTGSVLKHFPGYGGNSDTHKGFSVDSRPYRAFLESDFLPFEAGIQAGAGSVMVSHNIVQCMDEEYPASLSPEVHRILREELGFEGVIMTDDLFMNAIADSYGVEEAAVLAVKAGNDMLCCTEYEVQIPAVIEAVKAGQLSEAQIDAAVLRLLLWKQQLGLMEPPVTDGTADMAHIPD